MEHVGLNKDKNQNKTSTVLEKIWGFHSSSVLKLILFLGDATMLIWVVLWTDEK
jgi:hypothetical protein